MNKSALRVLSAGLLISGAALMNGQPPAPPNILRIFREDIKSGKGAAHEKVESAYARAFAKAGYPSYIGMDNLTGTSQAWFIESYDSYESIGKAVQLSGTEPLKSTTASLDAQDGELRTGERNMIATYQKETSYVSVPSNLPKARFVSINTIRVRPGHAAEFTEMRKLANAAFEKSGSNRRRVVYLVSSGAPVGTYLILSFMDSLKSMDQPAGSMSMPDAFGPDNLARYNKLMAENVVSSEITLFSINPKMSNPAKEVVAADPDFWTPKPKAAAKPAGAQ